MSLNRGGLRISQMAKKKKPTHTHTEVTLYVQHWCVIGLLAGQMCALNLFCPNSAKK